MSNYKFKIMMNTTTKTFISAVLLYLLVATFSSFAQDSLDAGQKKNHGTHNSFNIDLGINNYLEDGKSPEENNEPYAVRPWGSWYVALKSINDTHVAGSLHLLWGADVSWYNFKFQNDNIRLTEGEDQVDFVESPAEFDPVKSKLTAAYINISMVPMVQLGQNRHRDRACPHWFYWDDDRGFRIGIGGYGGYKLASYTKTVVKDGGDKKKDRDKDGFYLNNIRYGLRLQAGFRHVDLFFNYDLNELFDEGRGPELNAFSFGVVL